MQVTYERCCSECVDAFKDAGQLQNYQKRYGFEYNALPGEECDSCTQHLVDGEIFRVNVNL